MESGWLSYEYTGLTHRDVLLGTALALPKLYGRLAKNDEGSENQTFSLLAEFCAICDPSVLARIGYGLDRNLIHRLAETLEHILTSETKILAIGKLQERLKNACFQEELLDIWVALDKLDADPGELPQASFDEGLAAGTAETLDAIYGIADQLDERHDPVCWERASRLRRMDLVLVNLTDIPNSGVVLGSDVGIHRHASREEVIVDVLGAR